MNVKYVELNGGVFRTLMKERQLSHAWVARRLGISTKTVQRWLNAGCPRIRAELLSELANILCADPDSLISGDREGLRTGPVNDLVRFITSDEYFFRVRAYEDWGHYIQALRAVPLENLPTHQEVRVLNRLGVALMANGSLKAGKERLDRAREKALALEDHEMLLQIESWRANYEFVCGHLHEGMEIVEAAEARHGDLAGDLARSVFYMNKGRLLHFWGRPEQCMPVFRHGIRLAFGRRRESLLWPSLCYPYLGWTFLRLRRYTEAKDVFVRSLSLAEASGWPQGIALSHMALGFVDAMLDPDRRMSSRTLGKARKFFQMTRVRKLDIRYYQLRFAYYVLVGAWDDAAAVLREREASAAASSLFHAHLVLDSLLLQRVSGRTDDIAQADKKRAAAFFGKNGMEQDLAVLTRMLGVRAIDLEEFFESYSFF